MPYDLMPDDEVRWFRSVFLGPPGYTFFIQATYAAYGVFAVIFIIICTFKGLMPGMDVNKVPIFEVIWSGMATAFVMNAVDHDKPVPAIVTTVAREFWTSPRRNRSPLVERVRPTLPAQIKRHERRDAHEAH